MSENMRHFDDFWPFYVAAHQHPRNRFFHFLGTCLGFACLFTAAFTERPLWLLAGTVIGYSLAWVGHFLIEKNNPATFRHPLWSLKADFRMFYLMLNGKMAAEIEKYAR
jgi:hypothetical protein